MRSAASSIPSLLAEGRGRHTVPDQQHFYREARGSTFELQTQIEMAIRQQFIKGEEGARLTELANEVGRLINGCCDPYDLRPNA
jgi:four helix bundle protein